MNFLTKRNIFAILLLLASVPAVAQDVTGAPLTRAQVRADVVALEKVGYYPSESRGPDYPMNLQQAMQKVADQRSLEDTQYGSPAHGNSQSGSR